jgi:hypothetical protein
MEIEKEIRQIKEKLRNHQERISELENSLFKEKKRKAPLTEPSGEDFIIDIVNKIKNCEESDKIETQVLDERNEEGRILLPYYVSYKYFSNRYLTTVDIEKITGELGVKIKAPNVANKIKEPLLKYLDSASTRKRGKPTLYKLNRKGIKYFEEILYGKNKETKEME